MKPKKVDKEWVMKWIKDPQSFRYNTWMPHFFDQPNNSDEGSIARNDAEIYAITEFCFGCTPVAGYCPSPPETGFVTY